MRSCIVCPCCRVRLMDVADETCPICAEKNYHRRAEIQGDEKQITLSEVFP